MVVVRLRDRVRSEVGTQQGDRGIRSLFSRLRQVGCDQVSSPRPIAEPGPERLAAKRQERENGSTSVETTGHLLVRALIDGEIVAAIPEERLDRDA